MGPAGESREGAVRANPDGERAEGVGRGVAGKRIWKGARRALEGPPLPPKPDLRPAGTRAGQTLKSPRSPA